MTFPVHLLSFISSKQDQEIYSVPGTYTFTVPPGVTMLSAACIGGGGGGAGSNTDANFGTGGGGGGGLSWGVFTVQPGDVFEVTVGSGGLAGATTGNGGNGGSSILTLSTRGGLGFDAKILEANGGSGGTRANPTGNGGNGGTSVVYTNTHPISPQNQCTILLSGGGTGGSGGSSTSGAAGGGGAAGYTGNGGNGGSIDPAVNPTAAALNSGGGGGGGGSNTSGLAWGGGGVGAFGFLGTGQGAAGVNNSSGGQGGSFFSDPGVEGINATLVNETDSTTNSIAVPAGIQAGDFLLLLSGADKDSGVTEIAIPAGFTLLSRSNNGQYYTSSRLTEQRIIPENSTGTPSRDLNFASSYFYVPDGYTTTTITGLTSPGIHNLIALRSIPGDATAPAQIQWTTTSGDPSLNPGTGITTATPMPDPPIVSETIPNGAVSVALGFLANTTLNPSNQIAPTGTTIINSAQASITGTPSESVAIMASYVNVGNSGGTYDPPEYLTGTASHSRAYTFQINRSNTLNPVQVVASKTLVTTDSESPPTSFDIADVLTAAGTTLQSTDLVVCATALDGGAGNGANVPTGFTEIDQGGSDDQRQPSSVLLYQVSYRTGSTSTTISGLSPGSRTVPQATVVIVFRNAVFEPAPTGRDEFSSSIDDDGTDEVYGAVYDTGPALAVGAPNPPSLQIQAPSTTTQNSIFLMIGMIDDSKIANVGSITPPTGYTTLTSASYGAQNNGAIIMSAIKLGLTPAASENPSSFIGNGSNIWASQTIIIGGPGSEPIGTNLAAGRYGGGGGSRRDSNSGTGMAGASGAVRIVYGMGRQYPLSDKGRLGNVTPVDWT